MKLQINGKQAESKATNLQGLINELELNPKSLVVEHNSTIIRQQNWAQTALQEGDSIELLSFVGGG